MSGRIILFGATGYTGVLTARALRAQGATPVLAGRDEAKLSALARSLGGLDWAIADIERPQTLRALLERGDALISTVGPFGAYGAAAVEAAIDAGASYFDCNGEPDFLRRLLADWGPRAAAGGAMLAPSMGSFFSTSNLAGALALEQAGPEAVGVDLAYLMTGEAIQSVGSMATIAATANERPFAFRDGALSDVEPGLGPSFAIGDDTAATLAMSSTDHILLPRLYPQLRNVSFGMGVHGQMGGVADPGPNEAQRARVGSLVAARALGAGGETLAEVRLSGPCGYDITAGALAWAARRATVEGCDAIGWAGPIEAFGLKALEAGLRGCGLSRG